MSVGLSNATPTLPISAGVNCRAWRPQRDPQPDPVGQNAFPPELLMQHADEMGLSDSQKDSIRSEVEKGHGRLAELQQQYPDSNTNLGLSRD